MYLASYTLFAIDPNAIDPSILNTAKGMRITDLRIQCLRWAAHSCTALTSSIPLWDPQSFWQWILSQIISEKSTTARINHNKTIKGCLLQMQTAFCVLSVLDRLHDGDKRMANAIPHHSVPYQPILAFIKNLFRCFDVISLHIVPSYSMRLL